MAEETSSSTSPTSQKHTNHLTAEHSPYLLQHAHNPVLVDFQEDPKAAQEHMKKPMVMNKIQKLITYMRPWIPTRVTELLGFEDEVLINFIYGLLDGKVKELNSYVAVRKMYMSTLGNMKVELFDMGAGVSGDPTAEENVQVASNFELTDAEYEHALDMERLALSLAALKIELCPAYLSKNFFPRTYLYLCIRNSANMMPSFSQLINDKNHEQLQNGPTCNGAQTSVGGDEMPT